MQSITPKQHSVLRMVDRHIRRYGYAPSVREIASQTGRTVGAAHKILERLEERGRISRGKGQARSIEVLK